MLLYLVGVLVSGLLEICGFQDRRLCRACCIRTTGLAVVRGTVSRPEAPPEWRWTGSLCDSGCGAKGALVVVGALHPDRRVSPGRVVGFDPLVNCSNKFGLRSVDVAAVMLMLERRPERFGWTVVPAYSGRAHRSAQAVPAAGFRCQMRSVLAAAVRMQNRVFASSAVHGHRGVDGGREHVRADVVGDTVVQQFPRLPVRDRTVEHVTSTPGAVGELDYIQATPIEAPGDQVRRERRGRVDLFTLTARGLIPSRPIDAMILATVLALTRSLCPRNLVAIRGDPYVPS